MENAGELRQQLKKLKTEFLSNPKSANNLPEIIGIFEECVKNSRPVSSCLLVLEEIFTRLLTTDTMLIKVEPLKPKDTSAQTKYKEWLLQRYEDTWKLILESFSSERNQDSTQALVTAMKLLSNEGRHPFEPNTEEYYFPILRLKQILIAMLSVDKQNTHLFERFKEFSEYLDVLYFTWRQLPLLTKSTASNNTTFALNYLELLDAIPMTKDIQENRKLLCAPADGVKVTETFDYAQTRKSINKVWNCVMLWEMKDPIHKKVLIVLLERILPHLEKPIHLTDFLMDSLDFGGPIGLLALQGVFTLIQKHNITYPNVYEKLYSMFEPEIFHTKFKARLFYLADIFLSSTHLPENLVAAFVKRLARLSLIAPPQDAVIILYFIGNMILRHPSLKRLIAAQQAIECSKDPFVMEEREPSKSNAIESSLWEIVTLQNHAIPSVAVAAKFISQPLPKHEWDLSTVLDLKDDDIFDQEISRKSKQYALVFDRPQTMFMNKKDKVVQYWKLF